MPSPEVAQELKAFGVHPYRLLITPIVLLFLTLIATSLRFYVRGRMMRAFALDDWLLFGALIVQIVNTGVYIKYSTLQLDRGIVAVGGLLGQLIVGGECLYLAEQILLKASLGLYFLRIVANKWQKLTIQVLLSVYEVYTFAFLGCAIFAYGLPTAHDILLQWNAPHAMRKSVFKPLNYSFAALNIVVDLVFTFIPIYVVAHAMMPMRAKISVSALILLGSVGSIVSIARIHFLPAITDSLTFGGLEMLGVISIAESAAGSIAISLAAVRPLFKSFFGSQKQTTKGSKSGTAYKSSAGLNMTGISKRTDIDMVEQDMDVEEGETLRSGSEKPGLSNVQVIAV